MLHYYASGTFFKHNDGANIWSNIGFGLRQNCTKLDHGDEHLQDKINNKLDD